MISKKRARFETKTPAKRKATKKSNFSLVRTPLTQKSGFPNEIRMSHKYVQTFTFTAAAGAISKFYFAVNGMYDPYLGVGGAQPTFFDNMTALYNHYCVLSSKISVSFFSKMNQAAIIAVAVLPSSSSSATDINSVCADDKVTYRMTEATASANVARLSKTWNAKADFGDNPRDNDTLWGSPTANPSDTNTYMICAQDPTGVSVIDGPCTVTIVYDAVWFERVPQGNN